MCVCVFFVCCVCAGVFAMFIYLSLVVVLFVVRVLFLEGGGSCIVVLLIAVFSRLSLFACLCVVHFWCSFACYFDVVWCFVLRSVSSYLIIFLVMCVVFVVLLSCLFVCLFIVSCVVGYVVVCLFV